MTSFGWGQRQCLGQTLTQDELIVSCAALAWCFNLKPKVDPRTGLPLPVPLDKSNSLLIIKPNPFEMVFEPRSEERKREALALWDEADAEDQGRRAAFLAAAAGNVDGRGAASYSDDRALVCCEKVKQLKKEILEHIRSVNSELRVDL